MTSLTKHASEYFLGTETSKTFRQQEVFLREFNPGDNRIFPPANMAKWLRKYYTATCKILPNILTVGFLAFAAKTRDPEYLLGAAASESMRLAARIPFYLVKHKMGKVMRNRLAREGIQEETIIKEHREDQSF